MRRLSLSGLCLAAIAAAGVTWLCMLVGGLVSVGAEAPGGEGAFGLAIMVMVFFLFGLMFVLSAGSISAALALTPFILVGERLAAGDAPRRRAIIITACVACGLAYPMLGWLSQALGDGSPLKLVSYVFGFWPWGAIYDSPNHTFLGMTVISLAPAIGGLAAGVVYEAVTRPEPKGLTTPKASAI